MKVCFDVNVVINLFARTRDMDYAVFAYDVAAVRKFDVCIPASTLADIAYILHRRGINAKRVDQALDALFEMFDIIDVTGEDGLRAHQSAMKDFEDAVIAQSCARSGVDLIVTHNIKDFRLSPVPALTPQNFVDIHKPANYRYSTIEFE